MKQSICISKSTTIHNYYCFWYGFCYGGTSKTGQRQCISLKFCKSYLFNCWNWCNVFCLVFVVVAIVIISKLSKRLTNWKSLFVASACIGTSVLISCKFFWWNYIEHAFVFIYNKKRLVKFVLKNKSNSSTGNRIENETTPLDWCCMFGCISVA